VGGGVTVLPLVSRPLPLPTPWQQQKWWKKGGVKNGALLSLEPFIWRGGEMAVLMAVQVNTCAPRVEEALKRLGLGSLDDGDALAHHVDVDVNIN